MRDKLRFYDAFARMSIFRIRNIKKFLTKTLFIVYHISMFCEKRFDLRDEKKKYFFRLSRKRKDVESRFKGLRGVAVSASPIKWGKSVKLP